MKTLKIALVVAILFISGVASAQFLKEYKEYDNTGLVQGSNNYTKIYTVEQEKAWCYLSITTSGNSQTQTDISCIAKEIK